MADELNVDRDRIVVVGESAGAGLAAALRLLARDRAVVKPCFQFLSEPMLDDRSCNSDHKYTGFVSWTRDMNRFGWEAMLGRKLDGATVPSYLAPARAEDLRNLPPTYIHIVAA